MPGTVSGRLERQPEVAPTATVLAPLATRIASVVVMVGVLAQAALAGGFLAGHSGLTDIHMLVGVPLMASGLVLVGIGLVGGRNRREPRAVLLTRLGIPIALLATAFAGILAGNGTRDLLVIHIPLAIVSMGLAARLAGWARDRG